MNLVQVMTNIIISYIPYLSIFVDFGDEIWKQVEREVEDLVVGY